MNKAFYKCATCIYHKVDLEKEKCICILEKLNPKRKDLLISEPVDKTMVAVSGSWGFSSDTIQHIHEWICRYNYKFLNCPGYKKDET